MLQDRQYHIRKDFSVKVMTEKFSFQDTIDFYHENNEGLFC